MSKRFPSNTELLVMRLLRDEPAGMYGLELVDASNGRLKPGTVYVILGRLEENGFLKPKTSRKTQEHSGLPRPIYRLTALGERAVNAADLMRLDAGAAYI